MAPVSTLLNVERHLKGDDIHEDYKRVQLTRTDVDHAALRIWGRRPSQSGTDSPVDGYIASLASIRFVDNSNSAISLSGLEPLVMPVQ